MHLGQQEEVRSLPFGMVVSGQWDHAVNNTDTQPSAGAHWPWIVGLKGHAPLFNVSFMKSD